MSSLLVFFLLVALFRESSSFYALKLVKFNRGKSYTEFISKNVKSRAISSSIEPLAMTQTLDSFLSALNWRYFLAGALGASISHVVAVPLDVVKTKVQVDTSATAKSPLEILKELLNDGKFGNLFTGLGPTLWGYFIQGSCKYGFYEVFKKILFYWISASHAHIDSIIVFMISGAFAEFIGSTLLTPFEAIRIRMVSNPSASSGTVDCAKKIIASEGLGSLFRGIPAILLKNIPYTVVQLSSYEIVTNTIYSKLGELGLTQSESLHYQFLITTMSACIAGVLACLASQPGDTLLSLLNKSKGNKTTTTMHQVESSQKNSPKSILQLISQLGVTGLYKGTQTRLLHVTVIVVVQLVVYDYIKSLCGIPITGAH